MSVKLIYLKIVKRQNAHRYIDTTEEWGAKYTLYQL